MLLFSYDPFNPHMSREGASRVVDKSFSCVDNYRVIHN